MFLIGNFHDEIDDASVVGGPRFGIHDIRADVRDSCGDFGQHARAVLGDDRQRHGIGFS